MNCTVASVEALAESQAQLQHPELIIGDRTLALPADLNPGDYVEFWADDALKVIDRNGNLISSVAIQADPPMLQPGENRVRLRAAAGAPARFTCITTGDALSW
ncbi:MAG: hypothetical protein JW955_17155 [Sedimentisphaerales bacterium]|nr:hypothetical protein [Sedimentisphaerales bacterium]